MPSLPKIFSKKAGQTTIRDKTTDDDEKIPKFINEERNANPAEAKAGTAIRFMFDPREKNGCCHWLEGVIDQRVTKESQSRRTNYEENWFNVKDLRVLMTFGEGASPLPEKVRVNLAPRYDWYFVKDRIDDDILSGYKEAEFQIDAGAIPETSEFQEGTKGQEDSTIHNTSQRQYIVPGEIDSEILRSNGQQEDNEISRKNDEDNQSTASLSTVKSNSSVRMARVKKVPEVMNCKLTKEILDNMEFQAKQRQDISPDQMKNDIKNVREIFRSVEKGFDIAFAAGVLAVEAEARPMVESVEYAAGLQTEARVYRLNKAKTFLPKVSNSINMFLSTR